MADDSYSQRLNARLAGGVARLAAGRRARHAAYLLAAQAADGGWTGREGDSDLYYTGFALRGLAVLDALTPEACARAAGYLRGAMTRQASVVDFFSFLYSCLLVQTQGPDVLADSPPDWPDRVAATLETFATPDGGYNKSPPGSAGASSGSTYHTFLVGLCYELLGRRMPRPRAVADFVLARRREDGGFVEVGAARRGGTNPTAAAVGLLELVRPEVEALDGVRDGVTGFLAELACDDGGLRANGRVVLSDLLSTFTAAWTLDQLGAGGRVDGAAVAGFAAAVERAEGGFHGGLWDEGHDVEYTFYGLGVLGLFAREA